MAIGAKLHVGLPAAALLAACGGSPSASGLGGDASTGAHDDASQSGDPDAASSGGSASGSSGALGSASSGAGGSSSSGSSAGSSGTQGGASSSGGSGGSSSSGSSSGRSSSGSSSSSSSSSGGTSTSSSSGASSGGLCTYGTPTNGSGSFTWYYFGQGTSQQNGQYLTACGYQGTESNMIDTVQNIANMSPASSTYFAAIPGSSGFNTVNDCGACVEITNGGTSIVATIIDECPTDNGQNPACQQAGHLDLSYGAWKALNYSTGNPSGTTWKFVSCPVTGSITTRPKSGNNDQVFIENTVLPIVSVTYNGQQASHLSYGPWQLPNGANAAGATVTLTDVEGHTVTITIPGGGGSTGQQFPDRCP